MNRRHFTRGLASLGLTPALPLQALSTGSAGAAVATASAEKMYFMGWYTARLNKTCSPRMLASELNIDPNTARQIFAKLVENQTVAAPNAFGISQTVDPLAQSYKRVTGKFAKQMMSEPTNAVHQEGALKTETSSLEQAEAPEISVDRADDDVQAFETLDAIDAETQEAAALDSDSEGDDHEDAEQETSDGRAA